MKPKPKMTQVIISIYSLAGGICWYDSKNQQAKKNKNYINTAYEARSSDLLSLVLVLGSVSLPFFFILLVILSISFRGPDGKDSAYIRSTFGMAGRPSGAH